jgi:hypothetical protein
MYWNFTIFIDSVAYIFDPKCVNFEIYSFHFVEIQSENVIWFVFTYIIMGALGIEEQVGTLRFR